MDIHNLKITKEFFEKSVSGVKKFEIRKDDRDYKVGDLLKLNEINNDGNFSGRYVEKTINYIFGRGQNEKEYVIEGYVILSVD